MSEPRPNWGPDGLVAGIVQDAADGRVLMLGWLDAEALAATVTTGLVHFYSRSRGRLWRKGETSGHELRLQDMALDCDADALLLRVVPVGPTCHTGARSCFDAGERVEAGESGAVEAASSIPRNGPAQDFAWLETLWTTIDGRAASRPSASYTARLLDGGVDAVGRKVVEEATEVLMAAKDDATAQRLGEDREIPRAALTGELADLVYHALVLCAERSVAPADVIRVLRERHEAT
jgi:phosphoribosyl-AMP cyclohydrolase / phosphoribosyl-ATP pyrophosphohydrolase